MCANILELYRFKQEFLRSVILSDSSENKPEIVTDATARSENAISRNAQGLSASDIRKLIDLIEFTPQSSEFVQLVLDIIDHRTELEPNFNPFALTSIESTSRKMPPQPQPSPAWKARAFIEALIYRNPYRGYDARIGENRIRRWTEIQQSLKQYAKATNKLNHELEPRLLDLARRLLVHELFLPEIERIRQDFQVRPVSLESVGVLEAVDDVIARSLNAHGSGAAFVGIFLSNHIDFELCAMFPPLDYRAHHSLLATIVATSVTHEDLYDENESRCQCLLRLALQRNIGDNGLIQARSNFPQLVVELLLSLAYAIRNNSPHDPSEVAPVANWVQRALDLCEVLDIRPDYLGDMVEYFDASSNLYNHKVKLDFEPRPTIGIYPYMTQEEVIQLWKLVQLRRFELFNENERWTLWEDFARDMRYFDLFQQEKAIKKWGSHDRAMERYNALYCSGSPKMFRPKSEHSKKLASKIVEIVQKRKQTLTPMFQARKRNTKLKRPSKNKRIIETIKSIQKARKQSST